MGLYEIQILVSDFYLRGLDKSWFINAEDVGQRFIKQSLVTAGRHAGGYRSSQVGNRHGLQNHFSRTGDNGIEEAFAAKELVLNALNRHNVNGAGAINHGYVTGIHDQLFSGCQNGAPFGTIQFQEHHAWTGHFLHDEAFTGKQTAHSLVLKEGGQFYR